MIPKPLIVKGKKFCTKCKKWKPLYEYAQWTDNRGLVPTPRYQSQCKVCKRKRAKERYADPEYREKCRKYSREYYRRKCRMKQACANSSRQN